MDGGFSSGPLGFSVGAGIAPAVLWSRLAYCLRREYVYNAFFGFPSGVDSE